LETKVKIFFRKLTALALTAAATGTAMSPVLLPADSATAATPSGPLVHIANFTFAQQSIAVKPGTTVTWINDDDIPHTVVATNGSFKSKVLDTGDRFSFTFAKAGQFGYFCSLHPHMTGKVIVRA
jgi:plastocyanin